MNNNSSSHKIEQALAGLPDDERTALENVWDAASGAEPSVDIDPGSVEATWQSLRDRTLISGQRIQTTSTIGGPRTLLRRRAWLSLAAAFFIAATGAALWLQPVERYAPPGSRAAIDLPDGSVVELNSGSTIRYARLFRRSREVFLEGEAFFDVVNHEVPFNVTTFNGRIEVLGTRFNVRSWENSIDPSTIVALESGHLLLTSSIEPGLEYDMSPGQMRRLGGIDTAMSTNDTLLVRLAAAWRNGDLIFKDALLGVAIEDIERRFGIEVSMTSPSLLATKFTYNPHPASDPETLIRELSGALGVRYRPIRGGFEIY